MDILMATMFQEDLENKYNKFQALPRIKEYILSVLPEGYLAQVEAQGINPKFAFDLLAQMCLRKRTTPSAIVGMFRKYFESAQDASNSLMKCVQLGLISYDERRKDIYTNIELPADIQADIDLYQFPLPMIHEPMEVSNNNDTGFRTIKGSIILKDNHHMNDVNLDHINTVNAIALTLNLDTSEFITNSWENLDKPKRDESELDYSKRLKAFKKYDKDAKNVIKIIIEMGNRFYLTHNYCKRGRCHTKGYHITNQGNDWNKACVELANKETIS